MFRALSRGCDSTITYVKERQAGLTFRRKICRHYNKHKKKYKERGCVPMERYKSLDEEMRNMTREGVEGGEFELQLAADVLEARILLHQEVFTSEDGWRQKIIAEYSGGKKHTIHLFYKTSCQGREGHYDLLGKYTYLQAGALAF
ncbi:unnamed protein product [Owenia fusiformis]|uniref:Uncharacterized protein n=1 Tax=Owenia fusiformis TaxID=6347 RepID=A0A8S4MWQ4_OWEFU|nr:unnamed protein product [Owenia fusiformis]